MAIQVKGQWYMVNGYGELVRGKLKTAKCFGVLWKTVDGEWVSKVVAIRQGLSLTGEKRQMQTGHSHYVEAA